MFAQEPRSGHRGSQEPNLTKDVLVYGMRSLISEQEIRGRFSEFGNIESVKFYPKFRSAVVRFADTASVQACIDYPFIEIIGERLRARCLREGQEVQDGLSVIEVAPVALAATPEAETMGIRKRREQIKAYFEEYPSFKGTAGKGPYTFVKFTDAAVVEQVMSNRPHRVAEEDVTVRRCTDHITGDPLDAKPGTEIVVGPCVPSPQLENSLRAHFRNYGRVKYLRAIEADERSCRIVIDFEDYDTVDKIMMDGHRVTIANMVVRVDRHLTEAKKQQLLKEAEEKKAKALEEKANRPPRLNDDGSLTRTQKRKEERWRAQLRATGISEEEIWAETRKRRDERGVAITNPATGRDGGGGGGRRGGDRGGRGEGGRGGRSGGGGGGGGKSPWMPSSAVFGNGYSKGAGRRQSPYAAYGGSSMGGYFGSTPSGLGAVGAPDANHLPIGAGGAGINYLALSGGGSVNRFGGTSWGSPSAAASMVGFGAAAYNGGASRMGGLPHLGGGMGGGYALQRPMPGSQASAMLGGDLSDFTQDPYATASAQQNPSGMATNRAVTAQATPADATSMLKKELGDTSINVMDMLQAAGVGPETLEIITSNNLVQPGVFATLDKDDFKELDINFGDRKRIQVVINTIKGLLNL